MSFHDFTRRFRWDFSLEYKSGFHFIQFHRWHHSQSHSFEILCLSLSLSLPRVYELTLYVQRSTMMYNSKWLIILNRKTMIFKRNEMRKTNYKIFFSRWEMATVKLRDERQNGEKKRTLRSPHSKSFPFVLCSLSPLVYLLRIHIERSATLNGEHQLVCFD